MLHPAPHSSVVCAQPAPLAGDREELAEGECPLVCSNHQCCSGGRNTGGEKCWMWPAGLWVSWEGVSLRVVLKSILYPSREETNSTKPSVSAFCQHTQSCNNAGRVGGLWADERKSNNCNHTQKSLSAVSMLTGVMMQCLIRSEQILWLCLLLFCVSQEGDI